MAVTHEHPIEVFESDMDDLGHVNNLRYLEWIWDPDPQDTKYLADFVYMLREPDQAMQVVKDRHEFGLFGRSFWLDTFAKAGFTEVRNLQAPESDGLAAEVFLGIRP